MTAIPRAASVRKLQRGLYRAAKSNGARKFYSLYDKVWRQDVLWQAWEEVSRRLTAASHVALFSDFDGTLAPIVRHPDWARLPRATERALERLRSLPRVSLGVVSGRSLRDLRRRVGLGGIYYIGTHGLEWARPQDTGRVGVNAGVRRRIRKIGDELEAQLGRLSGIYVERKTVSVAVHYRNAATAVAKQARRTVLGTVKESAGSLRLLEGKKVCELLPPGKIDKGQAVLRVVTRWLRGSTHPLVVYLGDDVTDETVFARLRRTDLGIHVGTGNETRARYRLRSPAEVLRFLEQLPQVLT